MEKLEGTIEKLSTKINEFSTYAATLEEQRKAYEHLKMDLMAWLEQIENQARSSLYVLIQVIFHDFKLNLSRSYV